MAVLFAAILLFSSCSVDYESANQIFEESGVPNFIFYDTKFDHYSDGSLSTRVSAGTLEFYLKDEHVYAKDAKFEIYDSDAELSAEGSTKRLSANQRDEIYVLLDETEIVSYANEMKIAGSNFCWTGRTEQLVSGEDDEVSIEYGSPEKRDIKLFVTGKGFSASSAGLKYRFTKPSMGAVLTDTTTQNKADSAAAEISTQDADADAQAAEDEQKSDE